MTSYEKNVFGVYSEERGRTTYTYGAGLISERRDDGEEYTYHYNHLGSAVAVTDRDGEVVFRIVYGTYGELYDIRNAGGISLLTAETAEDCTAAEVADALGLEYLYNGQYGVSTDGNGLYYMRARYYDQDIKRFINRDILSGNIGNSQSLNRYCYVQGNPVSLTDPFGLCPTRGEVYKNRALKWLHNALDFGGIFFDGFDFANVLLYHFEGRDTEAAITLLCLIPGMGNFFELPVRLTLKLGDNAGEALIKLGKKYLSDLMEKGSRFLDWAGGKVDDVWRWIKKKLGRAGAEGGTKTVKELISESDAAKKWGMLDDGTNQGVKHFSDYWEQYPERIPSLEQRLGVQEGTFNNSLDGFNNFTTQAERVISEATSVGNVRDINGKMIYYIDGAANPKKGVIVIVRDGKIQSMMPSDLKSFNKMQ